MPNPIEVLSLSEFERLLDAWTPTRHITEVHLHCTDHPRHSEFRGRASVEAMRLYHQRIGMADIAQHLTIDAQGLIWTGRPFDVMPASVRGHNGMAKAGPFMIEMVGLFENNTDTFQGNQKRTVQAVVRAVLAKCELTEAAVKFHREFPNTGKTCPGTDLDPDVFRAEIRALLASNTLRAFDVPVPRQLTRGSIERAFSKADLRPEPDYLEVPEHADAEAELRVTTQLIEQGRLSADDDVGARGVDEEFRDLIGHAVNTSQGILSGKGAMQNTVSDLDVLVRDHLTPQFATGHFKHLLFYAHGGLVSEKSALRYARAILPWWKSQGVYPIFVVWESSLFQSISKKPRARGWFDDAWDGLLEGATQAAARKVWGNMKANARRCSAQSTEFGQPGGLFELTQRLLPWLDEHKSVGLHAVGHSTGPIVLSRFMPLLLGSGRTFDSLSYLAPAIRTDDFTREVVPLLDRANQRVKRLRVFGMSDKAEQDDDVLYLYRKSLLYFVRNACEDKDDGRIVGLQRDLLDDQDLRTAFGVANKNARTGPPNYLPADPIGIEFSQREQDDPANALTVARSHGGFDNDEATMRSVLANVLGVAPATVAHAGDRFPSAADFEGTRDPEDASRAFDDDGDGDDASDACPCTCQCCRPEGTVKTSAFEDDGDDEDAAADRAGDDASGSSGGSSGAGASAGVAVRRRRAVCIGIDAYPTMPLSGCVNDSKDWQNRLHKAGFTVKTLRNREATRAKMLAALTELIEESQSGDQLVFQYAGHGTQVPDLNGDEVDRFDEALVPIDFAQGNLLIDDDIYAVCARLRDRPGVTLTFFMDCCNSGSNTRVAALPKAGAMQKVRFLKMPAEVVRLYKTVRGRQRSATPPPVSEREPQAGVVTFAACLDHEFAFETDGHGDFTIKAASAFDSTLANGGTNQAFITAVVKAFGMDRRQNPLMLDPLQRLKISRFLGGR